MSTLFMCGAGNPEGVRLAMICNDHKKQWGKILVLDDDSARHGDELIGIPIVGGFEDLANADPETDQVVNLVARTTGGRAAARKKIESYGVPFTALLHPGVDTFGSELANDVMVYNNATIGAKTNLGLGSVVFMGAVIGHGSDVSRGCVMAANSVLNARVQLGARVYIGTNSTVLPDLTIGDDATIAAGSVVIRDIEDRDTVIGVPADSIFSMAGVGEERMEASEISMSATELTENITDIWRKLLGLQNIDTLANFFDIGGNSVLALQMQDLVSATIGTRLSTTAVFRFPTISALVKHLLGSEAAKSNSGQARAAARKSAMYNKFSRVKSPAA